MSGLSSLGLAVAPISRIGWSLLLLLWLLPMQTSVARNVSLASGNLQLDPNHGNGSAWGKSKCNSCHFMSGLHAKAPKIKGIVRKKGSATCTGCHGSNGTKADRQCLICHNSKDLPLKPWRGGKHRHDFITGQITVDKKSGNSSGKIVDLKTTSRQCVVCHDKSDMDGKFEVAQDLTMMDDAIVGQRPYANISEFCLRCHNQDHQQLAWPIKVCLDQNDITKVKNCGNRDQSLRAEDHYSKIDAHGVRDGKGDGLYNGLRSGQYAYKSIVDCSDCHTMHGTKNPNLIIEDSRQGVFLLDKSLRDHGYKIEVDAVNPQVEAGNYSDLCVMCHSMTAISDGGDTPARNGLTGVHTNQGSDCKSCHNHGEVAQEGL